MKFLMNGCLLLATEDGSTVEIIEEIGSDNLVSDDLHDILVLKACLNSAFAYDSLSKANEEELL